MRAFEYAILTNFSAALKPGRPLRDFKTGGWILSKVQQSNNCNFEPDEKLKNLGVELKQRKEDWTNQFSGKRSRKPSREEQNEENAIQRAIVNKASEQSRWLVYEGILAKPEVLYVDSIILDLLNRAGGEGWETTGKLPGSQSQGVFGVTMMRRMLK